MLSLCVCTKVATDLSSDLSKALDETEALRRQMQAWPPKSAKGNRKGLVSVLDDELGFVD